jgi:uncharacterized protein involved in response to NO
MLAVALLRVGPGIIPDAQEQCWRLRESRWMAAFGFFLSEYGPMLLRPRVTDTG